MKIKVRFWTMMFFVMVIVVPSMALADATFRMDMDANTAGLQTDIFVNPGDSFTSNIEVVMDTPDDSLSSFGFSLWWDAMELGTPTDGDITNSPMTGWMLADPGAPYMSIESPHIYNFSHVTFGSSQGPSTAVVASINWTVLSPVTDSAMDIMPGVYHLLDEAYDGSYSPAALNFEGGSVQVASAPPVVPEPVSSILFLTGGAALGLNRFRRKRK